MNVLKRKLNNQKGASITWALLIFLVCAVVGSVVLVAGTVAAGRMSKLAESDRRYYAVTSTAGFLRDALGQKVTVDRTAYYTSSGVSYEIAFKDESGNTLSDNILKELIKYLMEWKEPANSPTTDSSLFWENKDSVKPPETKELVTELTSGNPKISALLNDEKSKITVSKLELNDSGAFQLTVSSEDGYSLLLNFDLVRTVAVSEAPGTSGTDTVTKTDTFQWILKEVKKTEKKDRA